jgi:U6 snRNA-associated Sm-like protein LSm8
MSRLHEWVGKRVAVMTTDGRHLVGTLVSMDQVINLVLNDTTEWMCFGAGSDDDPPQAIPYGVYLVRGDNVAAVGLVDAVKESATDMESVRFDPLPPMK